MTGAKWKVRQRERDRKRIRLDGKMCESCGATSGLTRHHCWDTTPGAAPRSRVRILCRPCHKREDDRKVVRTCECGLEFPGKRSLRRHQKRTNHSREIAARRILTRREWEEWVESSRLRSRGAV